MATAASQGILSDDMKADREQIVELLKKAYFMELETVMSYIANSVNPDGLLAREIAESLEEDIQEELSHAQQFATRIKELYGVVPGSRPSSHSSSPRRTSWTSCTWSRGWSRRRPAPSSTTTP
jgi:bacterioferritin